MSDEYLIPLGEASSFIEIKKSKFIGRGGPAYSVDEAKAFIQKIREEEPGFSHAVYGYIIGHGNSITYGMSDDGEPSGTAGRPVLEVLKGSGLGDVVLVVIRHFGGTKLGTGGLVKAYTESAQETLMKFLVEKKVRKIIFSLTLSYELFGLCEKLLKEHNGIIENKEFATDVKLMVSMAVSDYESFLPVLTDAGAGRILIEPQE